MSNRTLLIRHPYPINFNAFYLQVGSRSIQHLPCFSIIIGDDRIAVCVIGVSWCIISRYRISSSVIRSHCFLVVASFITQWCVHEVTVCGPIVSVNVVALDAVLRGIQEGIGPAGGKNKPYDKEKNNPADQATQRRVFLCLCHCTTHLRTVSEKAR
jgi:hypothetical protein